MPEDVAGNLFLPLLRVALYEYRREQLGLAVEVVQQSGVRDAGPFRDVAQ